MSAKNVTYGALCSESNDTFDDHKSTKKAQPTYRRLVSVVALAVALVGVALLVSTSNHNDAVVSKNGVISSLSKVTYESDSASLTHAPTPSSFTDDITRAPTPKALHPTGSPVEELLAPKHNKRIMKGSEKNIQSYS